MDYAQLLALRQRHPARRLLRADHAPLIASFLQQAFVAPNRRSPTPAARLRCSRTGSTASTVRRTNPLPRSASAYLDEWADNANGWLRKFYPPGNDEAHFELTPASEKAIEWLASLGKRQFVGTESRLLSIFELLRQMVQGSETDPQARILELKSARRRWTRRSPIRAGDVALMDDTRVRERFEVDASSRSLLADFRRGTELPRPRSPCANASPPGAAARASCSRRFSASATPFPIPTRPQLPRLLGVPDVAGAPEELSELLHKAFALAPVQSLSRTGARCACTTTGWKPARWPSAPWHGCPSSCAATDDQPGWRIGESCTCCAISKPGPAVREQPPNAELLGIDAPAPELTLPLDRPLYSPPLRPKIETLILLEGEDESGGEALFNQFHVDKARLLEQIRQALRQRPRISLGELLETYPMQHGSPSWSPTRLPPATATAPSMKTSRSWCNGRTPAAPCAAPAFPDRIRPMTT